MLPMTPPCLTGSVRMREFRHEPGDIHFLPAEQDLTLQYRWYLENADEQTAEHYLLAVHETIQKVAGKPDLGRPRHFMAPEFPISAAFRSGNFLVAISCSTGTAARFGLSESCTEPETCPAVCWNNRVRHERMPLQRKNFFAFSKKLSSMVLVGVSPTALAKASRCAFCSAVIRVGTAI